MTDPDEQRSQAGSPEPVDSGLQLIGATIDSADARQRQFAAGEMAHLRIVLRTTKERRDMAAEISLTDDSGTLVFRTNTRNLGLLLGAGSGEAFEVRLAFPVNLSPGHYRVDIACTDYPAGAGSSPLFRVKVCEFDVHNPWLPEFTGIAFLPIRAETSAWRPNRTSLWNLPLEVDRAGARIELLGDAAPANSLRARPGEILRIPVRLTNLSNSWLATKPPFPVALSFHLADHAGRPLRYDGSRTPLDRPVPPGGELEQTLLVDAPLQSGLYELHLSLVQERCFWFDGRPGNLPVVVKLRVWD